MELSRPDRSTWRSVRSWWNSSSVTVTGKLSARARVVEPGAGAVDSTRVSDFVVGIPHAHSVAPRATYHPFVMNPPSSKNAADVGQGAFEDFVATSGDAGDRGRRRDCRSEAAKGVAWTGG